MLLDGDTLVNVARSDGLIVVVGSIGNGGAYGETGGRMIAVN